MMARAFSTFITLFFLLLTLEGDTVVFMNGDRLNGQIVSEDDKTVAMLTENFGLLNFPRQSIKEILYPEEKPDIADPVATLDTPAPLPQEEEPTLITVEASDNATDDSITPREGLLNLARERQWVIYWYQRTTNFLNKINPLRDWENRLNFGYTLQSGATDRQDFEISFRTEKKMDENAFRATARYEYAEQDTDAGNQRITDKYQGEFRWRHDLSTYSFTQTNSVYRHDGIQNIEHEAEQSFGIGWRLIETERFSASITPAVTLRYQELTDTESETNLLGTIYQEFEYQINGTWKFFEEARASIDPNSDGQQKFDFMSKLEAKITDALLMNLRYEYEYDSGITGNIDKSQQKMVVGFGIIF